MSMMNVGVKIGRLAMCIFPGTMSRSYNTLNIKQRCQHLFGKNFTYLSLKRSIFPISHSVKNTMNIGGVLLGFGIIGFQLTMLAEESRMRKEGKRIKNEFNRIVAEIKRIEGGIGRIIECEGLPRDSKEMENFFSKRHNLKKSDQLQFKRQIATMKMVYEKSYHFIEECKRIDMMVLSLWKEHNELITEGEKNKNTKEHGIANKELKKECGFLENKIEQHERCSKWLIQAKQYRNSARLLEKEIVLLKQLAERLEEENVELRKYVILPKEKIALNALSAEERGSIQLLYEYFLSHANVTKANTKFNKDCVKYLERLMRFLNGRSYWLKEDLNM